MLVKGRYINTRSTLSSSLSLIFFRVNFVQMYFPLAVLSLPLMSLMRTCVWMSCCLSVSVSVFLRLIERVCVLSGFEWFYQKISHLRFEGESRFRRQKESTRVSFLFLLKPIRSLSRLTEIQYQQFQWPWPMAQQMSHYGVQRESGHWPTSVEDQR